MSEAFGPLLRSLRASRQLSQGRLALDAEVSARHISWLETGKSRPSREMVLLLGSALDLPLRERNRMLAAAGFTSAYEETPLDAVEMADIVRALDLLLLAHAPMPAVVMNRDWDVVRANEGFTRLHAALSGAQVEPNRMLRAGPNLIDAFFQVYRPHLRDAESFLLHLLPRLRREATRSPKLAALLHTWVGPERSRAAPARPPAVIPIEIDLPGRGATRWFTTYTVLGSPADITTDELTVEMFHPADAETQARWQEQSA